jgi:hypothetical protein
VQEPALVRVPERAQVQEPALVRARVPERAQVPERVPERAQEPALVRVRVQAQAQAQAQAQGPALVQVLRQSCSQPRNA